MTPDQMEAMSLVAAGKLERWAVPGEWRVYRDGEGRVVFERFAA